MKYSYWANIQLDRGYKFDRIYQNDFKPDVMCEYVISLY